MATSSEQSKLKIANILRRFTFSEWGGTETVVWNTSKALKAKLHSPEILSTRALDNTEYEKIDNIPIKRFKYLYPYFPLNSIQKHALDKKGGNPISIPLFRYLKNTQFNIYHSHTMGHLANTVYLISKLKKKPYVVSLHGGYSDVPKEEIENIMSPVKKSFHYGKFINAAIGRDRFMDKANGIICVGHNEYLKLKEIYKNKNIEYLPNGVDLHAFNDYSVDNSFRQRHNINPDDKVILCLSRIDYQKNQMMLVEALKQLNDKKIFLVIVGPPTSKDYLASIKDKVAEYNINNNVKIIEGLKPYSSELLEIYKTSDLFVLPSIHEPFGIVILEAWASKTPVIASQVGGIKKLVTDKTNGLLFNPDSIDRLIENIKLLLSDKELKNKLVKNAYNLVSEKYSWDIISEKLIEFYTRVIKEYY
ncbi:MAG: glycosyltransferase family 4 protein [bacterium]|nr:glycosyltransferase family 4 protein [bacterium]